MTITQIRKEIKERKAFAMRAGIDLSGWYDEIARTIETLWANGFVTEYSNDILKLANGYQVNFGNYETCHILQAFDTHCIKMDRKAVKEFAEFILN